MGIVGAAIDPRRAHADLRADAVPALVARLLRIDPREALFERRGFRSTQAAARRRLERVGEVFLGGYDAALATAPAALPARLDECALELRGFAYEGAAMGLALAGILMPWRWRVLEAFAAAASAHCYMVHVGVGWALAALRLPLGPFLRRLDPLLQWLAVDGAGFEHGYFHPRRAYERRRVPLRVRGYARRAYDQGLGRALWFVEGADVDRVVRAVSAFPEPRRSDLWSGVGLAAAYAGGVAETDLRELHARAGGHRPAVAQGACFAAGARARAGNPAPHTDLACRVLCGLEATEAAAWTERTREGAGDAPSAYEEWRRRVQARFAAGEAVMG